MYVDLITLPNGSDMIGGILSWSNSFIEGMWKIGAFQAAMIICGMFGGLLVVTVWNKLFEEKEDENEDDVDTTTTYQINSRGYVTGTKQLKRGKRVEMPTNAIPEPPNPPKGYIRSDGIKQN